MHFLKIYAYYLFRELISLIFSLYIFFTFDYLKGLSILIIHPLNNTRYNSQSYSKMEILIYYFIQGVIIIQ